IPDAMERSCCPGTQPPPPWPAPWRAPDPLRPLSPMSSAALMSPLPPASLQLRLDREALAANWHALARLAPGAATGAAVKAQAYGLGVDGVVPTLAAAGARHFFVAHWSEVPGVLR